MASGVNIKATSNVPDEAEDLLVFGLVLAILALGIIWIIKTLTGSLIGIGGTITSAPGAIISGTGKGIGSIFGGIANWWNSLPSTAPPPSE